VFYNWTCGSNRPPLEVVEVICGMTNQNLNSLNVKILKDYFFAADAVKIRDELILKRKTKNLKRVFDGTEPTGELIEMRCHLHFRGGGRRVSLPIHRENFLSYCKKNNIHNVYTYVKNGKLYISKKQKAILSNLYPFRNGVEISISKYYLSFMNIKGKYAVVVFEDFPKDIFEKRSMPEVAAKTVLRNRKIRSVFENNLLKRIMKSGMPTAIWEPRIEDFNGIPDLLLPNNIIVEFAGMEKEDYINHLIKKVTRLSKKRKYDIIIVTRIKNYEIIKKESKELTNVMVLTEKEFIKWVSDYSKKLVELMKRLNIEMKKH